MKKVMLTPKFRLLQPLLSVLSAATVLIWVSCENPGITQPEPGHGALRSAVAPPSGDAARAVAPGSPTRTGKLEPVPGGGTVETLTYKDGSFIKLIRDAAGRIVEKKLVLDSSVSVAAPRGYSEYRFTSLVLPGTMTSIGRGAFKRNLLNSVTIIAENHRGLRLREQPNPVLHYPRFGNDDRRSGIRREPDCLSSRWSVHRSFFSDFHRRERILQQQTQYPGSPPIDHRDSMGSIRLQYAHFAHHTR